MKQFILMSLFAVCFALPVMAQQQTMPVNPNKNEPMEITADQTLEWHRDEQKYIARGNVIAKQGDVQIFCDTLTADYRETAESSQDIYKLTAEGNELTQQATELQQRYEHMDSSVPMRASKM